ncbi:hypothetical protein NTB97_003168 [Salmonella enterica]|uniref:hypothetical protein n=1 Tax=Escherichia coli TaxID=562 RepID=UPI00259D2942|nr:hypothetical protein [Escherichia coli]EBD9299309.1 hypothetical protein [Salmonella enterica]EDZ1686461.1 hypothetical protein [Salmonella enterica]EEB5060280.1 hypothetical protein [Salmonella enterica]EKK4450584.1 hypothetical protein [Salmonella enterica]MDM4819738.1 hypothetical protein [Escherichia coli]
MKSCFSDLPVKDGKSGNWTLDTFEITKDKALTLALRAQHTENPDEYIPPGFYRRLSYCGEVVMSNTPMEIRTCETFIEQATGRVLINGLGLGMVLHAILQKDDITRVTVIEKEQDVINLVAGTFAHDPRVEIVHADAMEYCPPAGVTYDVVFHDIWPDYAISNLDGMERLEAKYLNICNWQDSWGKQQCEQQLIKQMALETQLSQY